MSKLFSMGDALNAHAHEIQSYFSEFQNAFAYFNSDQNPFNLIHFYITHTYVFLVIIWTYKYVSVVLKMSTIIKLSYGFAVISHGYFFRCDSVQFLYSHLNVTCGDPTGQVTFLFLNVAWLNHSDN